MQAQIEELLLLLEELLLLREIEELLLVLQALEFGQAPQVPQVPPEHAPEAQNDDDAPQPQVVLNF